MQGRAASLGALPALRWVRGYQWQQGRHLCFRWNTWAWHFLNLSSLLSFPLLSITQENPSYGAAAAQLFAVTSMLFRSRPVLKLLPPSVVKPVKTYPDWEGNRNDIPPPTHTQIYLSCSVLKEIGSDVITSLSGSCSSLLEIGNHFNTI